jgi:hypothetical protein
MAVAEASAGSAAAPAEAEPGVDVGAAAAAVSAANTSPNGKQLSQQQRTPQKRVQQPQQRREPQLQPTAAPVATTPATEAVADSDAATTGAAEAAAAGPGPEQRHIDDVTPGASLWTRARAHGWTERDDESDSEMSVKAEEEDSAAEDSEVEQKAGATRVKWVKDDVSRSTPLHRTRFGSVRWRSRVALRVWKFSRKSSRRRGSCASRTGGWCGRLCVACSTWTRNTSRQRLNAGNPRTPWCSDLHPRCRPGLLANASWKTQRRPLAPLHRAAGRDSDARGRQVGATPPLPASSPSPRWANCQQPTKALSTISFDGLWG